MVEALGIRVLRFGRMGVGQRAEPGPGVPVKAPPGTPTCGNPTTSESLYRYLRIPAMSLAKVEDQARDLH